MRKIKSAKRIVIKVGTSTLTHNNGNLNLQRIKELVRVIVDLKNSGKDVVLVTSGAIGVGVARLKLESKPNDLKGKQACASVGQSLLMGIYDKFFSEYNQTIGQVLLTKHSVEISEMYENAKNTFNTLLNFGVVPIVNENDTVSTNEIKFGDNDTLSAYVSNIIGADLLILLTDVDGLYDKNPSEQGARIISEVCKITDEIKMNCGNAGTERGTGGMLTKIKAVEIADNTNTKTAIINGNNPALVYDLLNGKTVGTYFDIGSKNE